MDRLRFLVSSVGAFFTSGFRALAALVNNLSIFRDEFVPNIQANSYFSKWASANKNGDYPKWVSFRDALLNGQQPSPPTMATAYGKALVAAGKMTFTVVAPAPAPAPVVPDVLADYDLVVQVTGDPQQAGTGWLLNGAYVTYG